MKKHDSKFDCLAVDIGATSGRVMRGSITDKTLFITEESRFSTGAVEAGKDLYWDVLGMLKGVYDGFRKCSESIAGGICIGIDTFGMDFALLDKDGRLIANPYSYRGSRGAYAKAKFNEQHQGKLFALTGIADREYNTSYMLFSLSLEKSWLLEIADKLLFMPDLLSYFLTGNAFCDVSIISPGQIVKPNSLEWDQEVCKMLCIDLKRLAKIQPAASYRGRLLKSVSESCNLPAGTEVMFGVHDTAVALEAIPTEDESFAFISSGTWSLMGMTSEKAIINEFTKENYFSNVCDLNRHFLVLKNIMGMWVIESCKKEWESHNGNELAWSDLLAAAKKSTIASYIDINNILFFGNGKMIGRIQKYCADTGQNIPETQGDVVKVVLESLSMSYKETFLELEHLAGGSFKKLYIVGGGSQNNLLNQYTANAVGVEVIAGPTEATVIGNVLLQAIKKNVIKRTDKFGIVRRSFDIKRFTPEETLIWEEKWVEYRAVIDKKRGADYGHNSDTISDIGHGKDQ